MTNKKMVSDLSDFIVMNGNKVDVRASKAKFAEALAEYVEFLDSKEDYEETLVEVYHEMLKRWGKPPTLEYLLHASLLRHKVDMASFAREKVFAKEAAERVFIVKRGKNSVKLKEE